MKLCRYGKNGFEKPGMIDASGRLRDTVYYSILDSEWPSVRARLEARLDARPGLQPGGTVSSSPP